jgi:hypothetical protein
MNFRMKSMPSVGIYFSFYTFMAFCAWLFYTPDQTNLDSTEPSNIDVVEPSASLKITETKKV